MGFKIVGRSRSKVEALTRFNDYFTPFVRRLPLNRDATDILVDYIQDEWMCNEWLNGWIDGGRIAENGGKVRYHNNG